jgi:hypothetical protein
MEEPLVLAYTTCESCFGGDKSIVLEGMTRDGVYYCMECFDHIDAEDSEGFVGFTSEPIVIDSRYIQSVHRYEQYSRHPTHGVITFRAFTSEEAAAAYFRRPDARMDVLEGKSTTVKMTNETLYHLQMVAGHEMLGLTPAPLPGDVIDVLPGLSVRVHESFVPNIAHRFKRACQEPTRAELFRKWKDAFPATLEEFNKELDSIPRAPELF